MQIYKILNQGSFSKDDIATLLSIHNDADRNTLYKKAYQIKKQFVGNIAYFRGLIEFSNICAKNCLYCGIRSGNTKLKKYEMTTKEILDAMDFAWKNRYGSVVLQSGEISTPKFVDKVDTILQKIMDTTNGEIGITLSCGEQTKETYKRWFESGARRYLLRIETSNKNLYYKIHPKDEYHCFENRVNALKNLKEIGYQTGSGIMVGLPFQTIDNIADDILFLKNIDIDMVGLGPYIEHSETPLYKEKNSLIPRIERFNLALKTIAILRILMKDINLASATALQAIDPEGREKALLAGANIIMPNITPTKYRDDYLLYEDKPCTGEDAVLCKGCLEARIAKYGEIIGYGEWGDSKHFDKRKNSDK
ncbi:MAG: [FeFe] hydrogenase H-cluster radical SAM maturase HydE [Proteobacteria bacterium]|nr:[FeFe] hydrogenase H-cluster radical SAM maturase HydE [Pseudomonadota bacterium]